MKTKFFWLWFLLLTFIITLPITWWGMAKVDFFYSTLHDSIGIDEHIQRFAPRNQLGKLGFEKTSKQERVELFHGVVVGIHHNGQGLDKLVYKRQNKKDIILFTPAEIAHLKDVANLLNNIKPLILFALVIWLLAIMWVFLKRIRLPSAKELGLLSLAWVFVFVIILLSGPEKVFNQLHIWIFPEDNQWFFYYEESLMSTMMKAPYLFGYISIILVCMSLFLTTILLKLLHLFQESVRFKF